MAFDPETSYAGDYQYLDRVKDVTWERGVLKTTGLKARFGDINSPDVVSMAAGMGLSSDAATIVVWEPKPSDVTVTDWVPQFAPESGHILRREDTKEGWLVKAATQSVFKGRWDLLVDREVTNG